MNAMVVIWHKFCDLISIFSFSLDSHFQLRVILDHPIQCCIAFSNVPLSLSKIPYRMSACHIYFFNSFLGVWKCFNTSWSLVLDVLHLRNGKHVPCFYRVIETRVEVWENEKSCGNTSRRRVFPQSTASTASTASSSLKNTTTKPRKEACISKCRAICHTSCTRITQWIISDAFTWT